MRDLANRSTLASCRDANPPVDRFGRRAVVSLVRAQPEMEEKLETQKLTDTRYADPRANLAQADTLCHQHPLALRLHPAAIRSLVATVSISFHLEGEDIDVLRFDPAHILRSGDHDGAARHADHSRPRSALRWNQGQIVPRHAGDHPRARPEAGHGPQGSRRCSGSQGDCGLRRYLGKLLHHGRAAHRDLVYRVDPPTGSLTGFESASHGGIGQQRLVPRRTEHFDRHALDRACNRAPRNQE